MNRFNLLPLSKRRCALSRRLEDYAKAQPDPVMQHDLTMASKLVSHLEKLTIKLAKPTEVPLHSGRRP